MAKILIPTPLRKFTENNATVEVTKNTIGDSIHELAEKHPGLKKHLIDEKGDIRSFIRQLCVVHPFLPMVMMILNHSMVLLPE